MEPLKEAALVAARDCLGITKEESVVVVTDRPRRTIAEALFEICQELAREALLLEMEPRRVNGEEPPSVVTAAMQHADVAICPTSTSLTHTDARRAACAAGTRVGTMPGITEDVMCRTMRADYHRIARLTDRIAEILTAGKVARITAPAGTDIRIPIEGISAIPSRGLVLTPGSFGNLPSGEAYLMPREGESEGVIGVDGSLAGIGMIESEPVRITIEKGVAVAIEGGAQARQFNETVEQVGPEARNLAELGVGTNDMAEVRGSVLEDEKVLGTIHLALGNNVSMGGTVNVPFHVDGIILKPSLWIDDLLLLDAGRLQADREE